MSSLLVAWSTWLVLASFYGYQLIIRIIPNVIMQDIVNKYQVNADEVGHFAGIYYIGYVLIHIPLGIILDHFSAKKVIPLCIILCIIGFAPLVYADSFVIASYGRLLAGLGSAGAAISAFKLLRLCFGEIKFPKVFGWMATFGLLCAVFGSGPLARLVSYVGWIDALNYLIWFGVALAVLSYFVIPNTKSEESFSFKVIIDDFKYLFSHKIVFVVSILGGFMIGPLEGFADAWSNQYLSTVYKLGNEEAGDLTQLVYIGMAVGCVVIGYLFEKTKSYYGLINISAIAMFACFAILLMNIVENIIILQCIFFIIGIFCAYQLIIIAKTIALVSVEHATFVSAVTNMIMMGFGYFMHRGIGKILHYLWDGTRNEAGSPLYSPDNFYYALLMIPIALIIGFVGCAILAYLENKKKKVIR